MKKLLTAEQYFNASVNFYPTLYCANDLDTSKLKVFDQMFNTIGNGILDGGEFGEHITFNKKNSKFYQNPPEKYVTNVKLFNGYTKMDPKWDREFINPETKEVHRFEMPDFNSDIKGLFTEEEKEFHPEVIIWKDNRKHGFNPYPNFQKEYSLVWRVDLSKYDSSWAESALWFYEECRKYFNSEKENEYHSAWPADKQKQKRLISDYQSGFNRHIDASKSQEEQYAAISKAYGLEYTGNVEDFIKRRWNIEKERIMSFIDETTDMLKKSLEKSIQEDNTPSI